MSQKSFSALLVVLLSLSLAAKTQAKDDTRVVFQFNEHDAIVLTSEILINGMMGGTGAYLTEHPDFRLKNLPQMLKSRTYWQGFCQGAIGGSLNYAGEKIMTFQPEFKYSILAGKQVSDFGTSITYTASQNKNWLEDPAYLTDIGPMVLYWQKSTGLKPQIMILPGSLIMTAYDFSVSDFDPELSLQTGLFVFKNKSANDTVTLGYSYTNELTLNKSKIKNISDHPDFDIPNVLGHEAIHTRIYFHFLPLDAIINYNLQRQTLIDLDWINNKNQPLHFGADLGWNLITATNFPFSQAGTPEQLQPNEYAAYQLFNYSK